MTTLASSTAKDILRPAILGGPRAITLDQEAANRWPIVTREDEEAVLRVLRSGEWSSGHLPNGYPTPHREVLDLESEFAAFLGIKHVLAHNNGTAAIYAALSAMDIGPGDEVIVPSTTWWSSVLPIVHCGGIPVFAEIDMETLALDPADVDRRVTPRTKAIIVTHLFGIPAKMDELLAVARKHNLKLMEDASHAHGATYKDRPVGTIGDCAVFSLQCNKLVPSAEGGLLVTNDQTIHAKASRFGHYERLVGLQTPDARFAATGMGFKFRMSPLSAAVARTQLRWFIERNALRNANCVYLSKKIEAASRGSINAYLSPPHASRVYFEFLVGYDQAKGGVPIKALAKALQAEGATVAAPRYPLLHQQPFFTEGTWVKYARVEGRPSVTLPTFSPTALPVTMANNGTLIKLPSFPNAERALLDEYALAFEKVFAAAKDLPREA